MSFSIKITPESQRKIDSLAKMGKIDLRAIFNVIGIGYRKEVSLIFDKKQARGVGLRWAPLSPKYAERKAIEYPGAPLLVRTGRLKDSITKKGALGGINIINKTQAVFGTTVPYGIYHDKGGKKIPKRNFSDVSERRKQIWIDQIENDIIRSFNLSGISVEKGFISG